MTDSVSITLGQDVLKAISEKNGKFVATSEATVNSDTPILSKPTATRIVLKFVNNLAEYELAEVENFRVVTENGITELKDSAGNIVPPPTNSVGGFSISCEKCARKTRSRKHKYTSRRLRKSSKKVKK